MSPKQLENSSSSRVAGVIPVRLEIITVLLLLSLALSVRLFQLGADPPLDLSVSSDVYTDPPQYILFAKSFVQTGEFNPFGDHRFAFFLESSVTVLAVLIFKLFGVGYSQANAVGLFYSFGSIFFFYLFLRRIAGQLPGILFLLLICFDYSQLFYGRLPFLEHAMTFFAFLSMVLTVYLRRWWGLLLAGASLAVAVFFGKIIGVIFLAPFAVFFAYRFRFESDDLASTYRKLLEPISFALGFGLIALFWTWFSYLPMQDQVGGYIGEKAVALYGAPVGLESISGFIEQMVTFGYVSRLFKRMPLIAIFGAAMIMAVSFGVSRIAFLRRGFTNLNGGHMFLAALIIAFYGSLMIFNYRPLRYQLVLVYAFYSAAAIVLSWLWTERRVVNPLKASPMFYFLSFPVFLVIVYQLGRGIATRFGGDFYFDDRIYAFCFIAAVVTGLAGLLIGMVKPGDEPRWRKMGRRIVVVIVVLGVTVSGMVDYLYWTKRPTSMARQDALDMAMIVTPEAVLSGPYAPQLTVGSRLQTVIHMFGVSEPDPDLFRRFPITHLLIDKQNEKRARLDYPEIMDSAVHICTYHIGLKKTRLFRIAGHTGNSLADSYERSDMEKAIDYYRADSVQAGNRHLAAFIETHRENSTGYLLMAERSEDAEYIDEAEQLFKKAVEFSPTNYDLNARLAQFYKDQFEATADRRLREEGLAFFEAAIWYAPTVGKIRQAYQELRDQ